MSTPSDTQPIIDTALASAQPFALEPDQRYSLIVPGGGDYAGSVQIIDPIEDEFRDVPRRPKGTTTVYDVDSLAVLWEKHSHELSEVFADPIRFRITAVLNADGGSQEAAGFRDHRLELICKKTPAWEAWLAHDGALRDQTTFAEFLEDRLHEIEQPSGAEMLEIATSFQASSKVEFKSAVALTSSTRALQYEETTAAKAGQTGQLEIPATFVVALQPFEGGAAYRVTARFRYRITNGKLQIGYRLERPEDVLRTAFNDVREAASEATGKQVLFGSPADAR